MKYGFVNSCLADMWGEPRFNSERVNQVLFSELVEWEPSRDRFVKATDSTGYKGWIDQRFLTEAPRDKCMAYHKNRNVVVTSFGARTFSAVSAVGPLMPYRLSCYSKLSATYNKKTGWYKSVLPDGSFIMVGGTAIKPNSYFHGRSLYSIAKILGSRMLGVPYLWGGASSFGCDCSSFVRMIFSLANIALPRDTKDQITCGVPVARSAMMEGDLVFFDRHVGIIMEGGLLLHCSVGSGGVALESIDSKNRTQRYRADLDASFKEARRFA